jgi:hypothetical protein
MLNVPLAVSGCESKPLLRTAAATAARHFRMFLRRLARASVYARALWPAIALWAAAASPTVTLQAFTCNSIAFVVS